MGETIAVNPLIEQFRRGGVPKELRLLAAQGALPLRPEDLLELWTDLAKDSEPEVCAAAQRSLSNYAVADMLPILRSRDTAQNVLSWAIVHRRERELREAALQNASVPDAVIESLAGTLPQELAELVV